MLSAPAYVTVNPSYTLPELLLPYSQASGAFDLLPTGEPLVRLGSEDRLAYIKRVDIRTKMAASQAAANMLPSVGITLGQISTPTYLQRVRAEYDHHDTATAGIWGVDIVNANRLGMRQGHFQLGRSALLYGFQPANGEGIIHTNGATSVNLPPDPNGNDTLVTYDNGAMAFYLLGLVQAIKTRTNQMGDGRKFTFLGPQRTMGPLEYNVVQLTQYQRPGSGTASTKGTLGAVLDDNEDQFTWSYDDTLIGQGAGGNDLIVIVMPEVEKPESPGWNTNEFAKLAPGLEACTLQLCDMAAPRELPVPLAGGAVDVLSELRLTPGWGVRGEAITLLSVQYM